MTFYTYEKLDKQIDLLWQRIQQPKRFRRNRTILMVPCLSLSIRRQFRPYWLWRKRDRSLLEMGALGLCLLVSLPKRSAK